VARDHQQTMSKRFGVILADPPLPFDGGGVSRAMRAERRAGELLIEMAKRKERHSGRGHTHIVGSRAATPRAEPKLADLGINKTQSSRWQKLAALPADRFEANVERASVGAYNHMTRRFVKEAEIERARARLPDAASATRSSTVQPRSVRLAWIMPCSLATSQKARHRPEHDGCNDGRVNLRDYRRDVGGRGVRSECCGDAFVEVGGASRPS
jgi:hypothetical protein